MTMKRQILKITVRKDWGLIVKYKGERDRKGTPHEVNEKVRAEPESDFTNALKRMGGYLIKCSSLGYCEHALEQDSLADQIATPDKSAVIKKVLSYVSKAIVVDKVEITWDETRPASVKITGTFTNHIGDGNQVVGPAIQLNDRNYGFEANLIKDVNVLLEATSGYLKGKYTQYVEDDLPETSVNTTKDSDEEWEEDGESKATMRKVA